VLVLDSCLTLVTLPLFYFVCWLLYMIRYRLNFITISIFLGRSDEGKRSSLISCHHLLCRSAQYSSKDKLSFAYEDWWQKAPGKRVQQSLKQKNN